MQARLSALVLALLMGVGLVADASAQGVQTGSIRGVVRDQQDLPVPGVTVTATSPALQGPRTVVSDASGGYALLALPAGVYEVRYELSGFSTVTQRSTVLVGGTVLADVALRTGGLTETVQVVAQTPAPIATPTVGINIQKEEIDALATPRDLQGIATLSPALTERSPNAGQVIINGAFAFDNVFMVNGVDVNDNLFASPQNLFIEDAIQETQVLTSGISAEYGRFSGGVINAITKSGGNTFTGSYRMNLINPSWTEETVIQKRNNQNNLDLLQNTQEATFGGPIVRDRLWFFTAGRYGVTSATASLSQTNVDIIRENSTKRGDIKLTGTVAPNHTIQGGFLNNPRTQSGDSGIFTLVIDQRALVTRSFPNHSYFTNYRGVWGSMLVEAQYSQRKFRFDNSGGSSSNIVDSPFFSATQCACQYNQPYFDNSDPTGRNNRQITGNASWSWTGSGRHDTKAGYEYFLSQQLGGNSQSSTGYVFNVDFLESASGAPVLDSQGRIIPNFVPGESYLEFFPATRGATMDVNNNSLYVQDRWTASDKLTLDLGARFEQVKVVSTGNIVSVNTTPRVVPRLGASYDLRGNGIDVVHVTYGQYSGRYNEAQVGGNSPVGNPSYLPTFYQGPAGTGLDFAAGLNIANYPVSVANLAGSPSVPLANIIVDPETKTPLTHEFSTSYGRSFNNARGFAEATYVWRRQRGMIEDFVTIPDGTTNVTLEGLALGTVSNIAYRNSDIARRDYQAAVFSSRYQVMSSLSVNGHYTVQLKNHGNYEGEGTNLPGDTSQIGNYPEATPEDRYYPYGRLQNFQRHRMRLWTIYNANMGRFGKATTSAIWRVDSGLAYSLIALNVAPTATQIAAVRAAGYVDQPGARNVFFGERGGQTFEGYGVMDWSATYDIPVFRSARPYIEFDVFNIFNNQKTLAFSTSIRPDPASPLDAAGIPTGFIRNAAFGTTTGPTVSVGSVSGIPAFPQWVGANNGGRTFRVQFGVRF